MSLELLSPMTNDNDIVALYRDFLDDEFEKRNLYQYKKIKELFLVQYPCLKIPPLLWEKIEQWHRAIVEQDFLNPLLEENFEEIIFHDAHHISLIKNHEKTFFTLQNLERKELLLSLRILALRYGEKWNYSEPFQSFSITKGKNRYRVTLTHPSISPQFEFRCLLRKAHKDNPALENFFEKQDAQKGIAILNKLIDGKENFIVAGATGSGKTTLLKGLIALVPKEEHVVILEDTYELHSEHFNHTHLLSMNLPKKGLLDYCAYALRLRPDRILLGEMRKEEVIPFILSMNTGHKGMMSTVHANSCLDAIHRLSLLFTLYHENGSISFQMITKLIAQSLNYVIFVDNKKIVEIIRVQNAEEGQIFYQSVFKKA